MVRLKPYYPTFSRTTLYAEKEVADLVDELLNPVRYTHFLYLSVLYMKFSLVVSADRWRPGGVAPKRGYGLDHSLPTGVSRVRVLCLGVYAFTQS